MPDSAGRAYVKLVSEDSFENLRDASWFRIMYGCVSQFFTQGYPGGFAARGEYAVMPDFAEPRRQHMQHKSPDELDGADGHLFNRTFQNANGHKPRRDEGLRPFSRFKCSHTYE